MRQPVHKAFRDKTLVKALIKKIESLKIARPVYIMEVCGSHTQTFFRFGLKDLLPKNICLISGPGCPVCITEDAFIDKAILLSQDRRNVIATFGDLLKVPGTRSTLEKEREKGAHIMVVYSPREALDYAETHPQQRVIFLGVGFETTAPLSALVVKEAKRSKLRNFFILSAHRLIPPALTALCRDKDMTIEGFLLPGHVSVVLGTKPYELIAKVYKKSCCICGFEPLDMLLSIYKLLVQITTASPSVENEYTRVVKPEGNRQARKVLREVFSTCDASWRGFGMIKKSGLMLNRNYQRFDAHRLLKQIMPNTPEKKKKKCLCADVIKGKVSPMQCPQFHRSCSPENPQGPCMVSNEGSCRIYHEYRS